MSPTIASRSPRIQRIGGFGSSAKRRDANQIFDGATLLGSGANSENVPAQPTRRSARQSARKGKNPKKAAAGPAKGRKKKAPRRKAATVGAQPGRRKLARPGLRAGK